ncbi:MAG: DUF4321 domain-containing protein [Oscillospiraceae bacterium]
MNKKNILLLFMVLAGIILGAVLANFCAGVPFLQWLAYGKTLGIDVGSPVVLDLSVIRLAFGLEIGINVAQILCIFVCILIWRPLARRF